PLVRLLSVPTVQFVYHIHPLHYVAEGGKALRVQTAGIVAEINEKLCGPRVGSVGLGVGEESSLVAHDYLLIHETGFTPLGSDGGIAMHAELNDKAGHPSEELDVVEESVLDKVVEPVGPDGSPGSLRLYDERPFRGYEFGFEGVRRLLFQRRGFHERG